MAKMFCKAHTRIYWNHGHPTAMNNIYAADEALSKIEDWVDRRCFEAARNTTGDRHVQHVTVELYDFHAEEAE